MKYNALLVALLLSACTVGPDYEPPQVNLTDSWFSTDDKAISQQAVQLDWWNNFGDPLLEKYIVAAAAHNKDVVIASANVLRARALRRQAGTAFLPEIGTTGEGRRFKSGPNAVGSGEVRNLYDAGFDASWEIDIFGGTRRAYEAAGARAEGAEASYHDVLLATLSEVARNYYEARGLQKRIAITEQSASLQEQTFTAINARLEVGEANEFDTSRARSEYQLTQARVPGLKAELQATIYSLSVLLGLPPEALLDEMRAVQPLPTPPDMVPVGLRSDLLRRRPDIRAAERELAASNADIGVEVSELFPKFFITGSGGFQSRSFGDVFKRASGVWSLATLIDWPIFQAATIQARIDAADADKQAALANYEKSVLEALKDAETALVRYGRELETRGRLEEGVQSHRISVQLAKELFDEGEADYLAVLDAQRELANNEDSLVISETQSITKLIALYAALGGGWEVFGQTQQENTETDHGHQNQSNDGQ
ncbi:MAG: efflux transporter outer membrane subunit [Alphaproteobacteria bacterium]